MSTTIINADALSALQKMPDESVHCCITSPPYWGLRGYGGDPGMIGLEPTFGEHVENLVAVFQEVRRVLRSDGTCWVNYGDSYSGNGRTTGRNDNGEQTWSGGAVNSGAKVPKPKNEMKPKDLMMMPARVAIALQDDGWLLRSEIIWHKCLSGGAWLYAKTQKGTGVHMLTDLTRLDPATVQLWNGKRWTQVVSWAKTATRNGALELVLRSGERIGCTSDHKWPTQRGLVAAGELKRGDVLETCTLPDGKPPPKWLTADALWFAGLYLAEGSMSGTTIQISGHVKEVRRWERIKRLCEYYGATPNLYNPKGKSQVIHIDRSASLRAVLDVVLAGRTAKDKHLGDVWGWSNKALLAIVDGYFDGDGYMEGSRIRLGFTRNYSIERDLRCLAARLGAVVTIKPTVATIKGVEYPAFRGEWRWTQTGHWNEKPRAEVMTVRRSRARQFWDVSVADDPHSFALASGVLTHNSNPMPESVTDRPTSAHEKVFLLTKSPRYFYDAEAVKVPHAQGTIERFGGDRAPRKTGKKLGGSSRKNASFEASTPDSILEGGVNLRNVWTITTQAYPDAHFATFPEDLVVPCLTAGTSERGACSNCGAPWVRDVETPKVPDELRNRDATKMSYHPRQVGSGQALSDWRDANPPRTVGWSPSCECNAGKPIPCRVLDPFGGSGTVALVADKLGRDAVLVEINEEYCKMAEQRVRADAPMFANVEILK